MMLNKRFLLLLLLLRMFVHSLVLRAARLRRGPLEVARGLLEADVALLVGAAGAETDTDEGGPRAALEEEDGEDDAEAEAEGGLDEHVGEAAVPL